MTRVRGPAAGARPGARAADGTGPRRAYHRVVADMSETLRRAEITTRDLAVAMGRILEWHGVDGPMDSQDVLHDRIEAGHAALTRYRQWASGR